MGTLATWGAIAGGAKGFAEGVEKDQEIKQHKLDQEREERLMQMRMKHDESMATTRFDREKEMQTAEWGQEEKMTEAERNWKASQETGKQTFEGQQGALDRASREKIANIEADAREKTSKASSKNKWTSGTRKIQGVNEDGMPIEKTVQTMTSPTSNITYVQKGDIWTWDESEGRANPPVRMPKERDKAEADLLSNPTEANIEGYMRRFGYLPLRVWDEVNKRQ
jgi:hypothetical protein